MTLVTADPTTDLLRWRAGRELVLREPHGWLSVVGLHALTSSARHLPALPGLWWTDGQDAYVQAGLTEGLTHPQTRETLDGTWRRTVAEGSSILVAAVVPAGRPDEDRVVIELVRRTGRLFLRVRDPLAPARVAFTGVPAYPYDPTWVLDAPVRWYDEPVDVTVGAAQRGLVHRVQLVGEIDVERDGVRRTVRLTAGHAPGTAGLLFSDEADGLAPWRSVDVDVADRTAPTVRVDLNRTVNLPFAFSDVGTCPAPVAGNHLPFAVTAGERDPRGAVS